MGAFTNLGAGAPLMRTRPSAKIEKKKLEI
jgi:hypothetical protein